MDKIVQKVWYTLCSLHDLSCGCLGVADQNYHIRGFVMMMEFCMDPMASLKMVPKSLESEPWSKNHPGGHTHLCTYTNE